MAIKSTNCSLQVTITKERMEQLQVIVDTYNDKGVKCTKSDIIDASLDLYIKALVASGLASNSEEVEEPQQEKKEDA